MTGPALSAIIITLAAVVVPGLGLGAASGLRGRPLWGLAPAMTFGFIAVAARGYPVLGIEFRPWSVVGGWVVAVGVALAITAMLRRRWPGAYPAEPARRGRVPVAAAIAGSSGIGVAVVWLGTDGLRAVPQGFDAVMHGAAIRLISQTGEASPFALAAVGEQANPDYYYPAAFHALGALVLQSPGGTLPQAYLGLLAAVPVVFVLATTALIQRLDPRPVSLATGAVLAGAFGTFPFLSMIRGPLSPFGMALACAPGVIAVVLAVMRRPGVPGVLGLAIGATGVYTLHPGAAAAVAVMVVLVVGYGLMTGKARSGAVPVALAAGAAGAALLTFPSVDTGVTGTMVAFDWPAEDTVGAAVGHLLSFSARGHPTWWLLVPTLAGVWAMRRRPQTIPFAVSAVVFAVLYVAAAASDADVVQLLTGLWWNDKYRLMMAFTVAVLPVTVAGAVLIIDRVARYAGGGGTRARAAVAPVALAAVLVGTATVAAGWQVRALEDRFIGTVTGPDKIDAFAEFAARYDGGTVMNDPSDGSPWLYSLYEVPVVLPAMLQFDPVSAQGAGRIELFHRIDDYGRDPVIDALVQELDVRWVIVGQGAVHDRPPAPGFAGLADNPLFVPEIVTDRVTVYRIVR